MWVNERTVVCMYDINFIGHADAHFYVRSSMNNANYAMRTRASEYVAMSNQYVNYKCDTFGFVHVFLSIDFPHWHMCVFSSIDSVAGNMHIIYVVAIQHQTYAHSHIYSQSRLLKSS